MTSLLYLTELVIIAAVIAALYFTKKQNDKYRKQIEDLEDKVEALGLDCKTLHRAVMDDIMGFKEQS